MSDYVDIVVAQLSPGERTTALLYVYACMEVAEPGPWRELLSALEDDLIYAARAYERRTLRMLDPDRARVTAADVAWGEMLDRDG